MATARMRTGRGDLRATAKPELLAPAGDRTCLIAAVENGADAVYFGLQRHNARARAANFDGDELAEVMALLHRRGVKGYVTLNTLVFPRELADLETTVRQLAEAGVDAVIVQDLGLARLIRAVTPDLEIHASTQMTITSAEGVRLARELGCSRVILARELSLEEIARVRETATLPVEVFVHGALCVAYSGQCLTSEALGGRSANRGECAQACRMPYEIVCDGELQDLENIQYLLSPQDLAAFDLIPQLVELGVASLKIEGRLKTPEYVANITRHYRAAIDAAWEGRAARPSGDEDVREMELSFSRGFSHGFLDGNNHKVLVRGDHAKKRGIFLGEVTSIVGDAHPTEPGRPGQARRRRRLRRRRRRRASPSKGAASTRSRGRRAEGRRSAGGAARSRGGSGRAELRPARPRPSTDPPGPAGLEDRRPRADPPPPQDVRGASASHGRARHPCPGRRRRAVADRRAHRGRCGRERRVGRSPRAGGPRRDDDRTAPRPARPAGRDGLPSGRLAGDARGESPGPSEPAQRPEARPGRPARRVGRDCSGPGPSRPTRSSPSCAPRCNVPRRPRAPGEPPHLAVLCRTTEQVEAAVASGIATIYADYQDIKGYKDAVAAARRGSATIYLATPRIQKPFESNIFRYLSKQGADGLLVRNAGGLFHCAERGVPFVADLLAQRRQRADGPAAQGARGASG